MKTSSAEVRCDNCDAVIPVMHPTAIFVTLRGPKVRHKKADACNAECFALWAGKWWVADTAGVGAAVRQGDGDPGT